MPIAPSPRRLVALSTAALSLNAVALAATESSPPPTSKRVSAFTLTMDGDMIMNMPGLGMDQSLEVDTEMNYTWAHAHAERTLAVSAIALSVAMDGQPATKTRMDREKLVETIEANSMEMLAEDAPSDLRALLRDSFSQPLCRLQMDENGATRKQQILARPGAQALIEHGLISNALLFHPLYRHEAATWTAPCALSMGNGNYARGLLTYTRVDDAPLGTVEVSGTLTSKPCPAQPESDVMMENVLYHVTGRQTYDETRGEWTSGKLNFKVSFDMTQNGESLGNAAGTMVAGLELLPAARTTVTQAETSAP